MWIGTFRLDTVKVRDGYQVDAGGRCRWDPSHPVVKRQLRERSLMRMDELR